MRAAILALAALIAAPVVGRAEVGQEYRDLYRLVGPTLLGGNPESDLPAAQAMIAELQGRWFPALKLSGDGPELGGPELIAATCAKIGTDIVPVGRYSFDVVRTYKGGTVTTHFVYLGAGMFQSQVSEEDLLNWLSGNKLAELPTGIAGRALRTAQSQVTLLHPSPNVLALLSPTRATDIWGRCP